MTRNTMNPDPMSAPNSNAPGVHAPYAAEIQTPYAAEIRSTYAPEIQAPDAPDVQESRTARTSTPRAPLTAVAVSGGADSLYSLIRLQEEGVPVIAIHGLFAQELELGQDPADREAALAVRQRLARSCETLGVPLHVADLSRPFMENVIRPFVEGYAAGLTPNPCALCNRQIKFGLLLEQARALGATRMATGHYVRAVFMEDGQELPLRPTSPEQEPLRRAGSRPCPDSVPEKIPFMKGGAEASRFPALLQGADPNKDQSYFLSLVPKEQLAYAFFPLGEARKADVLQALKRRGIEIPQPGESRGACFLPDDDYRRFVPMMAERLGLPLSGPGPMLLRDGTRLGTHKGLWNYTEGQRHGLGIGWKEPLRVLAKEKEGNVLRLGPREELWTDACLCAGLNVLLPPKFWPETLLVKTRYREEPRPARVEFLRPAGPEGGYEQPGPAHTTATSLPEAALRIHFLTKETAVAPGQMAALYMPVPDCFEEDGRPVLRLVAGAVIV